MILGDAIKIPVPRKERGQISRYTLDEGPVGCCTPLHILGRRKIVSWPLPHLTQHLLRGVWILAMEWSAVGEG